MRACSPLILLVSGEGVEPSTYGLRIQGIMALIRPINLLIYCF
jgi:hypothetical protein